jgi:hypothetical protein
LSQIASDVATVTAFGLGVLVHVCRKRCHGLLSLPKGLPAKPVREAWREARAKGWEVAPIASSTWSTDNDSEHHELRRPGVKNTLSDCEAELN